MDNIAHNIEISRLIRNGLASVDMGVAVVAGGRLYDKTDYYCCGRTRDDYLLLLTLDGKAWVKEGARRKTLCKGSWFLLRPKVIHSYRDILPWSFAYLHFRGAMIDRVLEMLFFFKRENLGFSQSSAGAQDLLLRLLVQAEDVTLSGEVLRNALLLELLACLHVNYCENNYGRESLASAYEYINEHPNRELDLSFLAGQAGMSRFHLVRSFKAKYGEPPIRYLRKLRIEKAKNLLLQEPADRKIYEIAATAGFNDPLYFSRIFKQCTGMSPEKFRTYAKQQFKLI
ncbi:MAG: AraC family transcriptional regulator [Victivallaceae bacterium]|nr:AraC family transcriptional regulator [Victivallaceae bacterium]